MLRHAVVDVLQKTGIVAVIALRSQGHYKLRPRLAVHPHRPHEIKCHCRSAVLGLTTERVPRRERYIAFRGSRAEQKTLRAAIADRIKPYPKRPTGETVESKSDHVGSKHIGFVKVRRRPLKVLQDGAAARAILAPRLPLRDLAVAVMNAPPAALAHHTDIIEPGGLIDAEWDSQACGRRRMMRGLTARYARTRQISLQ